jgi:lysozyme family protein
MVDAFDLAMTFVWQPQNDGQAIHNTAGDPGGATSWGVTWKSWQAWCAQNHEPCDYAAFKAAPKETFLPLYRANYWNAARCDRFGPGGIAVFDMAVLSGPGRAVRLVQRVCAVTEDGVCGPRTLAAAAAIPAKNFIDAYTDERIAFLRSLPNAGRFPGWVTRAERCRDYCKQQVMDSRNA